MISFDEATRLARECRSDVDYVTEYPSAYVFSKFNDRSFGGNGPVVVLKDTGMCVNYVSFEMDDPDLTVIDERHL